MALEKTTQRKRGRPRKPPGISIESFDDGGSREPETETHSRRAGWADKTRLEVLCEAMADLDFAWHDHKMSHRDRAQMSTSVRQCARELQEERQRLADLEPYIPVPLDADALVLDVLRGLESLPRVLVDRIVAGAIKIQALK